MKASKFVFRYEIISLVRQRWLQFLGLILLSFVLFATINGKQKVDQRQADIKGAQQAVLAKDSLGVLLLDSIEAGFTVDVPRWYMPDRPHVVGYNYLRIAAMPPADLAIVATGQSDIYTHYVQPKLYGESFELNYTELSNPVQLMFGSFDLSFCTDLPATTSCHCFYIQYRLRGKRTRYFTHHCLPPPFLSLDGYLRSL